MSDRVQSRPVQQVRPAINLQATTLIGSDKSCDQLLQHPLVAPKHVRITLKSGQARLQDLGSGTFVNGSRIVGKSVTIVSGDQIDIGPFVFTFTGARLEAYSSMEYAQLTVLGLARTVTSGRKSVELFQDITLVFRPGEFVCLMGPSGSGKSSLLNCLSGRTQPTSGLVQLNRRDLHASFDSLKKHMAVVAQEPLTHGALTVEQALRFTAYLRLPLHAKPWQRVEDLIKEFELESVRKKKVSIVSGGQRKRFCLANELLSNPGLLFLDEVTSGLDEHRDAQVMGVFRNLAEQQRKTIVCITHSLANVGSMCNQIVVLAEGGLLAFVGTPAEALEYFKVDSLADIYPKLVSTPTDKDAPRRVALQFRQSPHYQRYLDERLPEDQRMSVADMASARQTPKPVVRVNWLTETVVTLWQATILSLRQSLLLAKDRWHWLSLITQILLVAFVLHLAFESLGPMPEKPKYEDEMLGVKSAQKEEVQNDARQNQDRLRKGAAEERKKDKDEDTTQSRPVGFRKETLERMDWLRSVLNFTFLVGVTSFWLGCNNAAREIVRERSIYQQEQNFNLRPLAYFLSKAVVLNVLVLCQVLLLANLAWYFCGPPDELSSYFNVLVCLAFCGTALGLMISAISSTESVAVSLIPIAIIPQIILSGAITKLDGELGWGNAVAQLAVTNYWGRTWMDGCITGEASEFGLKKNIEMLDPSSLASLPFLMIMAHAALFCAVTLLCLYAYNPIPRLTWSRR